MQLNVIHIARVSTANSFEVIPMDCDINKEFKDLGMSLSPPFAGLNQFTTSGVKNIGTVGDVE